MLLTYSKLNEEDFILRFFIEYIPIITFFIVYKVFNILTATFSFMIVTILSTIALYILTNKMPWFSIIVAFIVLLFGSLTIFFKDPRFIKMKPTIVQIIFAILLWVGLLYKRVWLFYLLGEHLIICQKDWYKLTNRFAWFFLFSAILNEIIWRTQSTSFWVQFHTFGIVVLTVIFCILQIPFIKNVTKD